MPALICSFERDGVRYYFDFCTDKSAPMTCALKLREYKRHHFDRHGPGWADVLAAELKRATETGTSDPLSRDLRAAVAHNRAGPRESRLGIQKLIDLLLARRDGDPRCKLSHAKRRGAAARSPEDPR